MLIFLVGAYSLNDFCLLLLVALPARYEKLSRYDLLRVVEVNMLTMLCFGRIVLFCSTRGGGRAEGQNEWEKVEEDGNTYRKQPRRLLRQHSPNLVAKAAMKRAMLATFQTLFRTVAVPVRGDGCEA